GFNRLGRRDDHGFDDLVADDDGGLPGAGRYFARPAGTTGLQCRRRLADGLGGGVGRGLLRWCCGQCVDGMGNRDSERRHGQGRLRLSGLGLSGLSGLGLNRLGGLDRRDVVELELGLGAVHRSDRGRFFAVGGDVVAIVGVELVACHHFILQRVASGNCTGFSGATTATAAATTTTAATTTARAFACGFATGSSRARFDRGRCTRFLRSGGHGVGSDRRGTGDGDRGRDIHQFRRCGNGSGFRLDGLLPGLLRLGLLLFAGRARGLRLRAFLGLLTLRVLLRLLLLLLLLLLGLLLLLLLGLLWLG